MKKILLASYGGGHINSLIQVARKLQEDKNINFQFLGFTTAKRFIEDSGFNAIGLRDVFKSEDANLISMADKLIKYNQHPYIEYKDALAYNMMGLKDNIDLLGQDEAIRLAEEYGRKSYMPVSSFKEFLKKNSFDLIITTSSPRFELALQKAASQLSIKNLSISDLFFSDGEEKYICKPDYAKYLTVFSQYGKDFILANGYEGEVQVTGNPAFDTLFEKDYSDEVFKFRNSMNLKKNDILILWACPHKDLESNCLDLSLIMDCLEEFSLNNPNYKFLIRQHPNGPIFEKEKKLTNGLFCPKETPLEVCLYACDIIMSYNSTVLVYGAILEKVLITHAHVDNVFDKRCGLKLNNFSSKDNFSKIIKSAVKQRISDLGIKKNEKAAVNVKTFIDKILAEN